MPYISRRFRNIETAIAAYRIAIYGVALWHLWDPASWPFFIRWWFGAVVVDIIGVQALHLFLDPVKLAAKRKLDVREAIDSGEIDA